MHQVEWFPFCACITQLSKTSLFFNNRVVLLLKNEKDIFQEAYKFTVLVSVGLWYRWLNCVEKHRPTETELTQTIT